MPRPMLSKSVRASAAASLVACTSGWVANSVQAKIVPVWIDAPSAEGVFVVENSPYDSLQFVDMDSDGLNDFWFYYYGIFVMSSRNNLDIPSANPLADILYSGVSFPSRPTSALVTPIVFQDRDEVFTAASNYVPLDAAIGNINAIIDSSGVLGGVFSGADGKNYAAYFEYEITTDELLLSNNVLTISDAGYALIPEPSSLALLGVGGLLLARRRRA